MRGYWTKLEDRHTQLRYVTTVSNMEDWPRRKGVFRDCCIQGAFVLRCLDFSDITRLIVNKGVTKTDMSLDIGRGASTDAALEQSWCIEEIVRNFEHLMYNDALRVTSHHGFNRPQIYQHQTLLSFICMPYPLHGLNRLMTFNIVPINSFTTFIIRFSWYIQQGTTFHVKPESNLENS